MPDSNNIGLELRSSLMEKRRILVVEDEESIAKQLKWGLTSVNIVNAKDPGETLDLLKRYNFKVITLDLCLPPRPDSPEEGFKLLSRIKKLRPYSKIIVITGSAEKENALRAIGEGAFDFCEKPLDLEVLQIIIQRAFRVYDLEEENRRLSHHIGNFSAISNLIGDSPPMEKLYTTIRKISHSDYPVLIQGESGTGKEVIARSIHEMSDRKKKPFVIINCGAIPDTLLESELFGYERGAFTGATSRKIGRLEKAHHGTAFFDEIGELPQNLQVKLLRFLQEGTVERLGSTQSISLDVRIVAATNVNLRDAVQNGNFREDLYFRLNVIPLEVPPLRERGDDILLLARYFLDRFSAESRKGKMRFTPSAINSLLTYEWPGNVRELENAIKRAVVVSDGSTIGPEHLNIITDTSLELLVSSELTDISHQLPITLKEARNFAEKVALERALMLTKNNITQAAKILKVSRPTIHDLIKKHQIRT